MYRLKMWSGRIFLLLIAAAAGYAYYAGWFTKEDVERAARQAKSSAKSAVRKVVGAPQGQQRGTLDDAKKCRDNLKLLNSIKRRLAQERDQTFGAVTREEVRKRCKDRKLPTCPAGGEYHLNDLGDNCECSIAANGSTDPATGHIIFGY